MPYYYKHSMWLGRNEWERLKTQADPPPPSPRLQEDLYLKDLIEKSQKWIKTWPDSVESHVTQAQKRADKDHHKEIAEVHAFFKQRKRDDTRQALAKARQLIFEGSSCGKQLLSALVASKVIEEREAQIAFKKELEKNQLESEKKKDHRELYFFKKDNPIEQEKLRKKKNVLFALENKEMHEAQNTKIKKDKEEETRLEKEDAALTQGLLDYENQEEKLFRKCQEDQIKKYEQDILDFKEAKKKREIENDKKIEQAKKETDCRLLKIKNLQQKYNTVKLESEARKMNYKLIEKIEKEKRKRFEDFVEKGVKRQENEAMKKEQDELTKQKNKREAKDALRKQQLLAIVEEKSRCDRICSCDRQCVIARSYIERHGKPCGKNKLLTHEPEPKHEKLQFLSKEKPLTAALRRREKEPSPFSGTSGAHAQFAAQAARTLADCKHKTMARRVVDEYRRINFLNDTTLPVKNY
ncbi:trichohyalin-like [Plodia interpunctella]|uniref:trichohyalin-like n=1 Tax=Plodia interpunctella TaxID=58824 RepID=UPI0023674739|nr:trichohyalin-like [Plodia interpunctella]